MASGGSGELTIPDVGDIASGVGSALVDWVVDGNPVGAIINGMASMIFNDSDETDSLVELQTENNENIKELTKTIETQQLQIQELTYAVSDYTSFMFFAMSTLFVCLFTGYLGKRVKRLISWRKMKRGEGIL